MSNQSYCTSLTTYSRRVTREVKIGETPMGAHHPIRVQSMTTIDTMDTMGSVAQSIRMIEAGCEYVRITAPSIKEAQNLENIKKELRSKGYKTPLVADIHFTPNAAELAARIVEKVRINPGNYADKKRFEAIEYTDESYEKELTRIRAKFTPLVKICKEYGTAMRIGTNHGSLSDRIMSRFGDSPIGMVESALEFVRICEDLSYYDIVLSMKSSNPQVMVQAYRLLVNRLEAEKLQPYPLHLGVTEAGEAEDGRIKSALGIGTLLEDGLGDTIRVSLTEDPEAEIPVGRLLVNRMNNRKSAESIPPITTNPIDPFKYSRRNSHIIENFGGDNVPRVIVDLSQSTISEYKDLKPIGHHYLPEPDKWTMTDLGSDYIYTGAKPIQFMLPNGLREIVDYTVWESLSKKEFTSPLLTVNQLIKVGEVKSPFMFVHCLTHQLSEEVLNAISAAKNAVVILESNQEYALADLRRFFMELINQEIKNPVVIKRNLKSTTVDQFMVDAAVETGGLLIDGFGDGIMLSEATDTLGIKRINETAFGILQAARTRISKTEYISCPSCGRTLFDLQETTAMIRQRTDHLKGLKIGIMGCIVNGPGEMADADYGYVGSGNGVITLYKGQEVKKKGVPSQHALNELIQLIKDDGKWIEPTAQH